MAGAQRERKLVALGQRDVRLRYLPSLLPSGERGGGVVKAACFGGFVREEFFPPAGVFWFSIFFSWAGLELLRARGGLCGCRAGTWLNPRERRDQMLIGLCCLCISGATFAKRIRSVIPHLALGYAWYPTSLGRCWVSFETSV